jgi:hypothetical protein
MPENYMKKHIIDLDKKPFCPDGLTVESHEKQGKFEWSEDAVGLFLSEEQKTGYQIGTELQNEVKNGFNANLLDQVSDEQTLLKLLERTARDNTKAVEQYLHYLVYNVKGSHVRLLALATAVQPPLVKAISSRRLGLAAGHVLRRLN